MGGKMNISLDLYRIFDAVVRAGSFSAAARELYISQPAVSQAVRQLEEALGTKLFTRGQRGISLTHEGELMRGYISSALSLIAAGEQRVLKLGELSAGELRIGAGDTVSRWFLLPVIGRFHKLYPDISINITNRTSPDILKLLQAGQIDIGFVNMPLSAEGVIFEECMPVHDVFIAGEQYSRFRGRPVSPAELTEVPLIMLERASNSRRWVDRHFVEQGVAIEAEIELGSHDLLSDYARLGLGVACVTREFTADPEQDGLFVVRLEPPVPQRSIGVAVLDGIPLSAASRRFIELAKAAARGS